MKPTVVTIGWNAASSIVAIALSPRSLIQREDMVETVTDTQ